jgi:hypothetical protein
METDIINFSGNINPFYINEIVNTLKLKTQALDLSDQIKKRLKFIAIELLQNAYNYGVVEKKQTPVCFFSIKLHNNTFIISCKNYITQSQQEKLESKLNSINSYTKTELKTEYLNTLSNGIFNDKGGAGLGFLCMKLNSESNINFSITNSYLNKKLFSTHITV